MNAGHMMIEKKEIDHARFRRQIQGKSADHICKVYDTQPGPLWAKLCGGLNPSLAPHDWKSCGAANDAGSCRGAHSWIDPYLIASIRSRFQPHSHSCLCAEDRSDDTDWQRCGGWV